MFGDQQQHQEHLVQLHRDTVSTSWGFRLQGGQEADTPLTVQRVFVGGVSDGKLHRGDVIVGIGGYNARGMYHSQAEDIIKNAGREISFKVLRGEGVGGGGGDDGSRSNFAQNDYSSYQVPWQTGASSAAAPVAAAAGPSWPGTSVDAEYEQRSVVDIRQQFSNPSGAGRIQMRAEPGSTSYIPKKPVIGGSRQGQLDKLSDPGWTPGSSRGQQAAPKASRYVPLSPPVNVHHQPAAAPYRPSPHEIHHETPESPAWLGTLRSSGGPRLWEIQEGQNLLGGGAHVPAPVKREQASRPVYGSTGPVSGGGGGGGGGGVQVHSPRIQTARYGPGGAAPTYGQRSAAGVDSDTARLAHLQYNTPIKLYSRESAREVLEGQARGKAGYGTLQITESGPSGPAVKIRPFDPVHSDVYRLVLEEDEVRKAGGVVYGADGGGGPSGGQRRQGSSRATSAPHAARPAHPPSDDQHSARFYQLVHENDDQLDQYASVHPGQYQHREPTVASMRDAPAAGPGGGGGGGFDQFGVSDF